MSANIPIGKLSFTVFGSGYNSDRADSGAGEKESTVLNISATMAEFDKTGAYCWIVTNSGLFKYETTNWTTVDQGDVPRACNWITKPKNNANGYGLALLPSNNSFYLFDLTTNEVINSGGGYSIVGAVDCIDIGDNKYRFCSLRKNYGQGSNYFYTVDLSDLSVTPSGVFSPRAFVGFLDEDDVYAFYSPTWFYQYKSIFSFNISGATNWAQVASDAGSAGFASVCMEGATKDGKIYVPTLVNGVWTMGEYNGMSQVNFNSPNPIRTFGRLRDDVAYSLIVDGVTIYSGSRSSAVMRFDNEIYFTDFDDVYFITKYTEEFIKPLAMTDNMILCIKSPQSTGGIIMEVFEF